MPGFGGFVFQQNNYCVPEILQKRELTRWIFCSFPWLGSSSNSFLSNVPNHLLFPESIWRCVFLRVLYFQRVFWRCVFISKSTKSMQQLCHYPDMFMEMSSDIYIIPIGCCCHKTESRFCFALRNLLSVEC